MDSSIFAACRCSSASFRFSPDRPLRPISPRLRGAGLRGAAGAHLDRLLCGSEYRLRLAKESCLRSQCTERCGKRHRPWSSWAAGNSAAIIRLGAIVFGVQGRFDGSGVSGNHQYLAGTPVDILGTNTNWYAAQTARIGYAVLPQALAYVKGGVAEARINYTDIDTTIPYWGSGSATRLGWTVGAGAEYTLSENWSIFAEYDYTDFGSRTVTLNFATPIPAFAAPYAYRETNSLQTVLVGVNYRFNLFDVAFARCGEILKRRPIFAALTMDG